MKTVAIIPVHGRLQLLKLTIERLLTKCGVSVVICLGDTHEELLVCEAAGAQFIHHQNKPVGKKLNFGFAAAQGHDPDAAMYLSSSDWISDNYLECVRPFINDYDMVAKLGCNFAHVGETVRAIHWSGYPEGNSMNLQPIGIGRVLSRKALDEMEWRPFDGYLNSSLDYSMMFRVAESCKRKGIMFMSENKAQTLSVSTDLWSNIHSFHQLAVGSTQRTNEWLWDNFPEIFTLKKQLYDK